MSAHRCRAQASWTGCCAAARWRAAATAIIAAGVVMLMQPFSLTLYSLFVRDHPVRHGDVHRRLEGAGIRAPWRRSGSRALDKSFGTSIAVKTASFTVEDGQFLCLLGPSGCGKTTTLRMIAGLELPTAGTIRLGGEDVTMNRASARDIAFVFQLFALYPHMNVRRNIGFPLKCEGVSAAEIERGGRSRRRGSCASPTCSTGRCRALPAATGNGSRLAGRSCASRNAS